MTVAGRIATGTALLILLLVAVLAYHLSVLRDQVAANRALSTRQVPAIMLALELRRLPEGIEEYARKLAVTGDPGYAEQLAEHLAAFDDRLARLRSLAGSTLEREALDRLAATWDAFRRSFPELPSLRRYEEPAARERLLDESLARLGELRRGADGLLGAAHEGLARQVERSGRARHEAERVALAVFGVAFACGLGAVLATVRSIHRPLRGLIDATGAVAEENFLYRLETPGGDEFSRLAAAFNAMVGRLAELDQMKKNLLSHVSHELKTPLANVEESHLLLLEELPGPLTAAQRRLLELNLGSCRRLARLIGNLLDRSRLDAGAVAYDLGSHDLAALAAAAVAEFAARAQEAGLLLAVDLPEGLLGVRCDRERILQVLENLLDNALKFSPAGGRILLRARALAGPLTDLPPRWASLAAGGGALVLIEVCDEGLGVPGADRERIFERFYRSVHRQGGPRGVGLGLAICRDIVAAHQGAIWVTANEPLGSRFCVLLPAAAEASVSASAAGLEARRAALP